MTQVPSRLKDTLRIMRERVDARLQEDQRKSSQFRRMSKAQESLMSEEEKKKRRKKIRKQMTQEAIQEPEAYPTSQLKRQLTVPSSTTNGKSPSSPKSPTSPATPGGCRYICKLKFLFYDFSCSPSSFVSTS